MNDETTIDDDERASVTDPSDANDEDLEALLDFLHRSRGFDFNGYKRGSLTRRIRRRMQLVGLESFSEYLDHLEVHPDEFPQLFNMLLINVTAFFRDPPAWQALAARISAMVDLTTDAPIRVWSAGCSSGEEPYTLAMLLAEILGPEPFATRVKIYATDVDEDALAHARQAVYSAKAVEAIAPRLVEKYLARSGSNFAVHKDLRRAVIFGRHDLVQDAPIPRVDVLTCRNALMYFNAETQTRILQRLQFALNPSGVLFLGKAEMLLTHGDMFTPLDLKLRLFGRSAKALRARGVLDIARASVVPTGTNEVRTKLHQVAFAASPDGQIVIDMTGRVTAINERAAQLFALSASDLGRPFHELELSYRPAELRSHLDKARVERRPIQLRHIERTQPDGGLTTYLDIGVVPLLSDGLPIGTLVTFADVTDNHRLRAELHQAKSDLEAAHDELQCTSEELETTNEELQSTVEELETTNEELQSTNEELETMNEELQSTNEELQTMNEELRLRGTELNELNEFHSAILGTLRVGLAVLDGDLRVRTWNERMHDLWGTRSDEVEGKHFLSLEMGLPIERIAGPIRTCLSTAEEDEDTLECTNRRGRTVTCKVAILPLRGGDRRGVIVLVDEVRP